MVTFLFRQIKATERKAKGLFHMRQSGFDQSFINMKADNEYDTSRPTTATSVHMMKQKWFDWHSQNEGEGLAMNKSYNLASHDNMNSTIREY